MGNKIDRYELESKMLKLRKEREKMQKEREEKFNEYKEITGEVIIRKPVDDYIDRSFPPNIINKEIVIAIKGIKRKRIKKKKQKDNPVVEEEKEEEIEEEEEEIEEEYAHVPKSKKKFKNNIYSS